MRNIADITKNILVSVGKNNKPTYTVMAVATANGIFKPISSLTDKKEKPEARKYSALREFLTEVVAVPTYWACGAISACLGGKLFKNNPEKKSIARANMMFLGVCTAAVFVIPSICSLMLKGLDKISNKKTSNSPAQIYNNCMQNKSKNNSETFGHLYSPKIQNFANRGGLKI